MALKLSKNKEVILIKEGELFLKGLNKKNFEAALIKNIKGKLKSLGKFKIVKAQSTIAVIPEENFNFNLAIEKISSIFGIASFSIALAVEKNFEEILRASKEYLKDVLKNHNSFKVVAKRSDKNFEFSSVELCKKLGEFLLNEFENLTVKLNEPEVVVHLEIRDSFAYLYYKKFQGAKGMPVGTAGDAILLLSGGIDSPVAAFMMAKRGLKLRAVHFESPPYTGQRALKKVEDLLLTLEKWTGKIPLHLVNITTLQQEIKKNCPENVLTIILRRSMLKITQNIAENLNKNFNCSIKAIVTGESLAQVASQTLGALSCIEKAASMPILRPLIGMDKDEIVKIAKKIKTYEISILPFEDCCTVFTPKHPKTNPNLEHILKQEENLNLNLLLKEAIKI